MTLPLTGRAFGLLNCVTRIRLSELLPVGHRNFPEPDFGLALQNCSQVPMRPL
jgi:hypothetical protein